MDLEKLWAVAEYGEAEDAKQLSRLAKNLNCFTFIKGASNYKEVGEFVTRNNEDFNVNPNVAKFFDYEAFGEHIGEIYYGEFVAYSTNPNEGYLSEKGVMALRSSFAKDIFAQDLLCEYKKQTEHRDALKVQSRDALAELIAKINGGTYDNPQVENLLQTLANANIESVELV